MYEPCLFDSNATISFDCAPNVLQEVRLICTGMLETRYASSQATATLYFDANSVSEKDVKLSMIEALKLSNDAEQMISIKKMHQSINRWRSNVIDMNPEHYDTQSVFVSSIDRVVNNISQLLSLFPNDKTMKIAAKEYNRVEDARTLHLIDFQMTCFKVLSNTFETQSPIFKVTEACTSGKQLEERLALFINHAKVASYDDDPHTEEQWLDLLIGLNITPQQINPLISMHKNDHLAQRLNKVRMIIQDAVQQSLSIEQYLAKYLKH